MQNFYCNLNCDLYYFPERFPVWNSVNKLQAVKGHILLAIMQLHKLHNYEICFYGNQNKNKKLLVSLQLKVPKNVFLDNTKKKKKKVMRNCNTLFQNNKHSSGQNFIF